jgi:hypothetical protein
VRCLTSWRRRASWLRIAAVTASGAHTTGRNPVANSRASERASILSVFRPLPLSPRAACGLASATDPTRARRISAIASALPVASSATRSSGTRLSANKPSDSGVVAALPAERMPVSSTVATSQKSRWTSKPMNRIWPPSVVGVVGGDQAGPRDSYGFVLAAHSGNRRGGHLHSHGLAAQTNRGACPTCVLPKPPARERRRR